MWGKMINEAELFNTFGTEISPILRSFYVRNCVDEHRKSYAIAIRHFKLIIMQLKIKLICK